ncbi:MAG: hypothetical protein A2889_04190 [Nitrospinae bacterium RIFCSPLOWO2_01_FULL_39_10]|nr:MAG: hypothetical protein A2889_04190 [Nitrospinae bacterium RIFCSPLOWO2_01_FULL_39_10]
MKNKRPNAVILYLSRSLPKDIADLKESLRLLCENFNNRFKYPVIIFHEDFDEKLIQEIRCSANSHIQFEKVKFEIPDFLNKDVVSAHPFSIGYRHMCRFFSGIVFQHPSLMDYDYYWRLDTDSFLLKNINYDVFGFMQRNNYIYGYITILKDPPEVVKNLWEATKKYIEENKIKPTFLNKFIRNGCWERYYYYTNFEIGNLNFFRSNEYMEYFNYLDRLGGIYEYRWGDTPIHTLAISMFVPENQVHRFRDVAYRHQSYENYLGFNIYSMKRISVKFAKFFHWLIGSKYIE